MADDFTVFVVDDDAGLRTSLGFLVEAAGLQVECFSSGADFLASHDGRPGCLVVDCFMPGMNGLELQARIPEGVDLPIIFISGHADEALADEALKAGAVAFLQKPVDPRDLIERLQRLRRAAESRGRRREG